MKKIIIIIGIITLTIISCYASIKGYHIKKEVDIEYGKIGKD